MRPCGGWVAEGLESLQAPGRFNKSDCTHVTQSSKLTQRHQAMLIENAKDKRLYMTHHGATSFSKGLHP